MAGDLVFDAASSNADGSTPGTALTVWSTASYVTTAFNPDAANQSVQWASSVDTEGALPASMKDDNRTISMTIECLSAAALRALQDKVGKISREQGTLKWTLPNSEVIIFDLLARESWKPTFDVGYFINSGAYCTVDLSFTAKPYGRGPEVDLGDNVETTLPVLIFTDTGVKGDVPGLGRLVIDDDQAQAQRTVLWGVRSRYYSAAAPLFYQAEGNGLAGVTATGPSGASGGASNNTVYNSSLPPTPSYSSDWSIGGAHVGTYRVIARVQAPATNTGTVTVRAQWTANTVTAVNNDWVTLDASYEGNWLLVDLGLVTSRQMPVGTSSLTVAFNAASTVSGDDIYWDWAALIPVDEGWGQAEATVAGLAGPLPASGQLQVGSDHVLANNGTWYRPNKFDGKYLLIPPAGSETRTLQIIIKASRGWLFPHAVSGGAYADAGTDDISARLYYTPRYLVVPSP